MYSCMKSFGFLSCKRRRNDNEMVFFRVGGVSIYDSKKSKRSTTVTDAGHSRKLIEILLRFVC